MAAKGTRTLTPEQSQIIEWRDSLPVFSEQDCNALLQGDVISDELGEKVKEFKRLIVQIYAAMASLKIEGGPDSLKGERGLINLARWVFMFDLQQQTAIFETLAIGMFNSFEDGGVRRLKFDNDAIVAINQIYFALSLLPEVADKTEGLQVFTYDPNPVTASAAPISKPAPAPSTSAASDPIAVSFAPASDSAEDPTAVRPEIIADNPSPTPTASAPCVWYSRPEFWVTAAVVTVAALAAVTAMIFTGGFATIPIVGATIAAVTSGTASSATAAVAFGLSTGVVAASAGVGLGLGAIAAGLRGNFDASLKSAATVFASSPRTPNPSALSPTA